MIGAQEPIVYARRRARSLDSSQAIMDAVERAHAAGALSFSSHEFLRRLNQKLPAEKDGNSYRNRFLSYLSPTTADEWVCSPPSDVVIDDLISLRLLPFEETLEFMASHERPGEAIIHMRNRMLAGDFDAQNPLHMQLEFSRYAANPQSFRVKYTEHTFASFNKLPRVAGEVILESEYDGVVAATAHEAVEVYRQILARKREEIPLLVIGNIRYGSLWVVEPIEPYLRTKDVYVLYDFISSMSHDCTYRPGDAPAAHILQAIKADKPDVIVVDGTMHMVEGESTRFPAAMWGYINEFLAMNLANGIPDPTESPYVQDRERFYRSPCGLSYEIAFWAPEMTENIVIGNQVFHAPEMSGARRATIMNSVGPAHESSHARLDDPERIIQGEVLALSATGLVKVTPAPNVKSLASYVQGLMAPIIKDGIEKMDNG
ncbi:hypothetical protein J4464_05425 [Candidatus Woesearchaeota archaeon]|nr:hypothetical protein [Candidatus Woesearchaeota archaeon]